MTREQIVAEARRWRGTPFVWQASAKGAGCDCKGLIAGIARELKRPEGDAFHARLASYGTVVDTRLLREGLAATFERRCQPGPGDVLLLRIGGKPQHLAICAGATMIHTYGRGPCQVVEVPFVSIWRAALDSVWGWKGVA